MKTLKLMFVGIALLFSGIAANASVKSNVIESSQTDVVNMYINAVTTGSTSNLDQILDNEIKFNSMRGENVNTLDKNQFVNYIKNNTVTGLAVTTTTTVLADDDNSGKIKIDFKYDGYTRTDVLTLDKSNGWKITAIDSSTK